MEQIVMVVRCLDSLTDTHPLYRFNGEQLTKESLVSPCPVLPVFTRFAVSLQRGFWRTNILGLFSDR